MSSDLSRQVVTYLEDAHVEERIPPVERHAAHLIAEQADLVGESSLNRPVRPVE